MYYDLKTIAFVFLILKHPPQRSIFLCFFLDHVSATPGYVRSNDIRPNESIWSATLWCKRFDESPIKPFRLSCPATYATPSVVFQRHWNFVKKKKLDFTSRYFLTHYRALGFQPRNHLVNFVYFLWCPISSSDEFLNNVF